MKIRNRYLVRAAAWLGAAAGKILVRSLRTREHSLGVDVGHGRHRQPDRLIYCIWHENLLLPTVYFGAPDFAVLISKHADGQLLGGLITAMGMEMICGSTNRGGVEAVRQLVRPGVPWTNLAITPDGPRGPRRVVQAGIVYVASRTGMKIVPIGVGYRRPWRLGSWDRFAIPRPLTPARTVLGEPIGVPAGLRSAALEEYRVLVQAEMERVNSLAERWVETGRLDLPAPAEPLKLAS